MYYYTVYKVTNQINGKVYIGTHKTKDLNDGYMGSGKYLKYSQTKHGLENFSKEILFVYDTPEPMYAKEAELVNEDFLAEENTYNIKKGGFGGFDYVNENKINTKWKNPAERSKNLSKAFQRNCEKNPHFRERLKENSKKTFKEYASVSISTRNKKYPKGTFHGRTHSDETKSKISIANSKSQMGENNSQFGTMWITDGVENRKIKNGEPVPEGWERGRKTTPKKTLDM